MNIIVGIIIVAGLWLFNIVVSIWFVKWMNKNSILIQISEYQNGVFQSKSARYRIREEPVYKPIKWYKSMLPKTKKDIIKINKKYYKIWDIFSRQPLKLNPNNMKKYYIASEGLPIVGIKTVLKLKVYRNKELGLKFYVPWKPSHKLVETEMDIENVMLAWTSSSRIELYEATKSEMSNQELMLKFVLPVGLIILAMACLIFYPKMYAAVMDSGNAVAKTAM